MNIVSVRVRHRLRVKVTNRVCVRNSVMVMVRVKVRFRVTNRVTVGLELRIALG